MQTVAAGLLRVNAVQLGLPRGKANLLRMMKARGIQAVEQRVAGGQLGVAYPLEALWPELRADVERLLSKAEPASAVDFSVYASAAPGSRDKAAKSVKRMEKVKAEVDAGATVAAAVKIVSELPEGGASPSTLTREWGKVKDLPWDQWHAALVPDYKGRKATDIPEPAWLFYKSYYARKNKPTHQQCYEETEKAGRKNGWGDLPSLKTFIRTWDALPAYVRTALREGEDPAEKTMTPRREIDRDDTPSMFRVSIDARIYDLFVRMPDGRVIRLVVAAAIDEGSGYGLHYEIGETENTALYRRLILGVARKHGLPVGFLFDNTMAAGGKDLSGQSKVRFRFPRKDDEVDGLLVRCGIEVHFTKPGSPQSKLVERAFNDMKDRTEKAYDVPEGAYCGRSPADKPEGAGSEPVAYDKFLEVVERGWQQRNSAKRTRSKITKGKSYAETYAEKLKGVTVRRLTSTQERYFLAKTYLVKPTKGGMVRIGRQVDGIVFWHMALQEYGPNGKHKGQKIKLLVDPEDFTKPAMAYTLDGHEIEMNVGRWTKTGYRNVDDQSEAVRRERSVKLAAKKLVKEQKLLTAAEMRALAAPPEPAPEHPKAEVVGMVPNRKTAPAGRTAQAAPPVPANDFDPALARGMEILRKATGQDWG